MRLIIYLSYTIYNVYSYLHNMLMTVVPKGVVRGDSKASHPLFAEYLYYIAVFE